MLRKDEKNSDQSMRSIHAESAPKLHNHYGSKNISQSRIEVLDEAEVSALMTTRGVGGDGVHVCGIFSELINKPSIINHFI